MSRIAHSEMTDTWYHVEEYDEVGDDGKLQAKEKTELGEPASEINFSGNGAIYGDVLDDPDGRCGIMHLGDAGRCTNDAEYFVEVDGETLELCRKHAEPLEEEVTQND